MAARQTIAVRTRTVFGKHNAKLRTDGLIPAVVYGQGSDSLSIEMPAGVFEKLFSQVGESTLIDLIVDEQAPAVVLVREVQRDPVRDTINHVDFYRVNMKKPIRVTVPIVYTGEAPAVKEHGGVLVRAIDHVTVQCLPADLVHEVVVDLSILATIDDTIRLGTLVRAHGITIDGDPEAVVVTVQPPRAEEVIIVAVEADVSKIAVEKKGKGEEADAAKKDS